MKEHLFSPASRRADSVNVINAPPKEPKPQQRRCPARFAGSKALILFQQQFHPLKPPQTMIASFRADIVAFVKIQDFFRRVLYRQIKLLALRVKINAQPTLPPGSICRQDSIALSSKFPPKITHKSTSLMGKSASTATLTFRSMPCFFRQTQFAVENGIHHRVSGIDQRVNAVQLRLQLVEMLAQFLNLPLRQISLKTLQVVVIIMPPAAHL